MKGEDPPEVEPLMTSVMLLLILVIMILLASGCRVQYQDTGDQKIEVEFLKKKKDE